MTLSQGNFLASSLFVPPVAGALRLRADSGPGLVIEARPGDTMEIQFKNRLPEETNLHFHGLHVPPTGNADNAFLMISPGRIEIL